MTFNSIHKRKIEEILLANGLPKEIVTAIMMPYKNTKTKVHSLYGDPGFFTIVARVLLGDALSPYMFIIYLNYIQ